MPSYKDEATGKWYCSFYYTNLQGRRVRKLKRGFKLKRDADKFERDWLSSEHGADIIMDALIDSYEEHLRAQYEIGNIKHSTLVAYQDRIRLYIRPYWKGVVATLVQPKNVNDWIAKLMVKNLKPLSAESVYYEKTQTERKTKRSSRTVNNARILLYHIFDYGIKNNQLLNNPVENSIKIKKFIQDTRAKYWTLEQYQLFSDNVARKDLRVLYDVLFFAGLRIGEAMALTPDDVQPYKLNINKALVQEKYNEEYFDSPKNEPSIRVVEIPKFLHRRLVEFIKSNKGIRHSDTIFSMPEQTVRNYMDTLSRKLGLPKISPHILRHSYASHLLSICKNPMVVAKQLGHANAQTTLKTYAHMIEGDDREAIDSLENLIENKK